MKEFPAEVCFNCERTDTEVPITNWQYQGQQLWVCSQCMPLLIHQLDEVVATWEVETE